MTREQIRSAVLESLRAIAPEADLSTLDPAADLRDTLDIDSMDFLSFITSMHTKLKVDIPERDYREVRTLDTCVEYLARRVA
jgi:acyl carrier protein